MTCGRLISRVFVNGLYSYSQAQSTHKSAAITNGNTEAFTNAQKQLKFLTAVSGSSKSPNKARPRPGKFGDDSYFVARHKLGDVLGK